MTSDWTAGMQGDDARGRKEKCLGGPRNCLKTLDSDKGYPRK
jgi:hypothetical protein